MGLSSTTKVVSRACSRGVLGAIGGFRVYRGSSRVLPVHCLCWSWRRVCTGSPSGLGT